MIKPYNFVGLIPTIWGIRSRDDINKNIDHLTSLSKAAYWLSNPDIPVRPVSYRGVAYPAGSRSC